MLSVSFLYPYKSFSVSAKMCDIVCQIHHHLQIRGRGNFNCSLHLVVYNDSIGLTIEDSFTANTFVIDTFLIILQSFIHYPVLFLKTWLHLKIVQDVILFLHNHYNEV